MIRPLNLQIAIIFLVGMAGILSLRQAQGQAMSATAGAAGVTADSGTTQKQEAKPPSKGSSTWTAGAPGFASSGKGAWGSSQSFSISDKSAWARRGAAFGQGGVQPGGVWHAGPNFSVLPGGESSTNPTKPEFVSAEPATRGVSISGIGTPQSNMRSRQFGIVARHSTMSARQFGMPSQGKAGRKPAFRLPAQRHSFAPTSDEKSGADRDSQSGSASAERHATTGLGDRPRAQSHGLVQGRLERGLSGTSSGFDPNPPERRLHSGQSKPQ